MRANSSRIQVKLKYDSMTVGIKFSRAKLDRTNKDTTPDIAGGVILAIRLSPAYDKILKRNRYVKGRDNTVKQRSMPRQHHNNTTDPCTTGGSLEKKAIILKRHKKTSLLM